jgi:hypothetical protein
MRAVASSGARVAGLIVALIVQETAKAAGIVLAERTAKAIAENAIFERLAGMYMSEAPILRINFRGTVSLVQSIVDCAASRWMQPVREVAGVPRVITGPGKFLRLKEKVWG